MAQTAIAAPAPEPSHGPQVINPDENIRHIKNYLHDAEQHQYEADAARGTIAIHSKGIDKAETAMEHALHDARDWAATMLPNASNQNRYDYIVSHFPLTQRERALLYLALSA